MTVPASNGIQQYTICQGVPTAKRDDNTSDYFGKVIAAYFTNKNHRRPWEELRMEPLNSRAVHEGEW